MASPLKFLRQAIIITLKLLKGDGDHQLLIHELQIREILCHHINFQLPPKVGESSRSTWISLFLLATFFAFCFLGGWTSQAEVSGTDMNTGSLKAIDPGLLLLLSSNGLEDVASELG